MSPELSQFIYWAVLCATFTFAVTAVLAVAPKGIDLFTVVVMGIITAIGGGLLRDVLAGRQNLLMTKELYAIPVLLGCTVYALLSRFFPGHEMWHMFICFGLSFSLRAAAIKWKLSVQDWLSTKRIN